MKVIGRSHLSNKDTCQAINSIPRFCYRSHYEPISGTNLTSDKGWGCCFRSSQGLIASFLCQFFSLFPEKFLETFRTGNPLALFLDIPSSPFGIQNLVQTAEKYGTPKGTWAKPSSIAQTVKDIFSQYNISCVIGQNFTISQNEIKRITFPSLVLIPGLFGLHKLDEKFISFLQLCLCAPGTCGFVSGHKDSAYFIFGFDPTHFLYFDPHETNQATKTEEDTRLFFTLNYKTISFSSLNPSILLGFLCDNLDSLNSLIEILLSCETTPMSITNEDDLETASSRVIDLD